MPRAIYEVKQVFWSSRSAEIDLVRREIRFPGPVNLVELTDEIFAASIGTMRHALDKPQRP